MLGIYTVAFDLSSRVQCQTCVERRGEMYRGREVKQTAACPVCRLDLTQEPDAAEGWAQDDDPAERAAQCAARALERVDFRGREIVLGWTHLYQWCF